MGGVDGYMYICIYTRASRPFRLYDVCVVCISAQDVARDDVYYDAMYAYMYMLRVTTMLCGMYTTICVHNMLRVTTLCCYVC